MAHENENKGMKDFLSKILRLLLALYIPYLLWGYFFWATKYFVYAGNVSVNLKQGLELVWNYSGWAYGWYLLAVLLIKILDISIWALIGNEKIRIIVWCVLFLLGGYFNNIYLISIVLKYDIYYQIGKKLKSIGFKENRIYNSANCLMFLGIASALRFSNHLNYIMDFCIAVSISGFIILIFSLSDFHSKVMETMGKGSMAPYVLHAHMTILIRVVLQKCGCQDFAVYVIAETVVAVLLSLIAIKTMERFKWIKAFFYPTITLKRC